MNTKIYAVAVCLVSLMSTDSAFANFQDASVRSRGGFTHPKKEITFEIHDEHISTISQQEGDVAFTLIIQNKRPQNMQFSYGQGSFYAPRINRQGQKGLKKLFMQQLRTFLKDNESDDALMERIGGRGKINEFLTAAANLRPNFHYIP